VCEMAVGGGAGKPTNINDIYLDDFEPRAGTPLLDAIGLGIYRLDAEAKEGRAVLVEAAPGVR
jgi:hypothetical protein